MSESEVHDCGAPVAPGETVCSKCFLPVVWAGATLDRQAVQPGPFSGTPSADPSSGQANGRGFDRAEHTAAPGVPIQRVECPGCRREVEAGATCPFCSAELPAAPGRADRVARDRTSAAVSLPGGLVVPVGAEPVMLGRLSDDDRVGEALDLDEVSREHANLRFDGTTVWLEDLGSTNGTWLGGRRISTRVRLPSGDVLVGLGRWVTVTVHVP